MDPSNSNSPPLILPYGRDGEAARGAVWRGLGLFFGAVIGVVIGILVGFLGYAFFWSGRVSIVGAGVCFLLATLVCAIRLVHLRTHKNWFVQGVIVGAAMLFLLHGLIFVVNGL